MKTMTADKTDDGYKVIIEQDGQTYIVRTVGLQTEQWRIFTIDYQFALDQANTWGARLGLYIHDRVTGMVY